VGPTTNHGITLRNVRWHDLRHTCASSLVSSAWGRPWRLEKVAADGNWLVSLRHLAQVLKVDRETGEVIWRFGGRSNDFTFVNDPFPGLCGQHSVTETDSGTILVFDNGQYCWPRLEERGKLTRVTEYEIDEDAMTAELIWSYSKQGSYSVTRGSAQRLPNGNTLIGWGENVGNPLMATELDPSGEVVFELEGTVPGGAPAISYRVLRFPE